MKTFTVIAVVLATLALGACGTTSGSNGAPDPAQNTFSLKK